MFFTTNSSVTRPIIATTKNPVQPQINISLADTSKKNTLGLAKDKDMRFGMISRVQGRTECFSCR